MKKQKPQNSQLGQLIFFFLILFSVLIFMFTMPRISVPLAISYVLYLVVTPLVPKLMKMGLDRVVSISVILLGFILLITVPIIKIAPVVKDQTESINYYIPKIEKYLRTNYQYVRKKVLEKFNFEIDDHIMIDALSYGKGEIKSLVLKIPKLVTTFIEWLFLIPLYLFFMLKDSRSFKRLVLKITPNPIFERFYYLTFQFNKQIGDYIFAKFVEASIVFTLITTGLMILDVRFSFLLGIFAGVTNIIPYVGPVIGMIPAIIIGLAEYGAANTTFGGIIIIFIVTNAIDIGLVFPILVSKIVDLHPVLVVISVILGSQYFGVVGMIISIPITAALKLILMEVYGEVYSIER